MELKDMLKKDIILEGLNQIMSYDEFLEQYGEDYEGDDALNFYKELENISMSCEEPAEDGEEELIVATFNYKGNKWKVIFTHIVGYWDGNEGPNKFLLLEKID